MVVFDANLQKRRFFAFAERRRKYIYDQNEEPPDSIFRQPVVLTHPQHIRRPVSSEILDLVEINQRVGIQIKRIGIKPKGKFLHAFSANLQILRLPLQLPNLATQRVEFFLAAHVHGVQLDPQFLSLLQKIQIDPDKVFLYFEFLAVLANVVVEGLNLLEKMLDGRLEVGESDFGPVDCVLAFAAVAELEAFVLCAQADQSGVLAAVQSQLFILFLLILQHC